MTQLKLFDTPQTQRTSDDYWTPKWVFDALGLQFELDVACPPEGPLHTPCKAYYTQTDDGLIQPWKGLIFMNPPYSNPTPWVKKWLNHADGIAVLGFNRGRWANEMWQSNAKCAMLALTEDKSKLFQFDTPEGIPRGIFMPIHVWAIGKTAIKALQNSGLGKVR
jgi:hypothetical protein